MSVGKESGSDDCQPIVFSPAARVLLAQRLPEFAQAYDDLVQVATRNGALSPKVRELVLVAVNVGVTHRDVEQARWHMDAARKHGATEDELLELCMLVSFLGSHTVNLASPMLLEEMAHNDHADMGAPSPADKQEIRQHYIDARGRWSELLDPVLELDPAFCDKYIALANAARVGNYLPVRVRELIAIAIDATTTHLYAPGLRLHIRNALSAGVSRAEIVETIELVSCIGVESVATGLELLFP